MRFMSGLAWSSLALSIYLVLPAPTALAIDDQRVNAGGPSGRELRAPEARDSFDFMIFGDRTGGPVEGIEVLKQAVTMANRMDADLVMTVGDLIQGHNEPDVWLAQMREYQSVMNGLHRPWYPVVGNHDVYTWPRQPGGHLQRYTEHFGPLYYSFDYKWAHFVVLFSDEQLSYGNPPADQNLSPEQLAWLRQDLASTKAAQIFVFLHHPRWTAEYQGCNWDEVHRAFVSDGRPFTVFAGHIHVYRDDGQIDNVHYYTLATTGGTRRRHTDTAGIHHVDFVRVRRDHVAIAVLPIGSVYGSEMVLGEEVETMDELARGAWFELRGKVTVEPGTPRQSAFALTLTNPADRTMHLSAELSAGEGWQLDPESVDQEVDPGESLSVSVRATSPARLGSQPGIRARGLAEYRLRSGLVQPFKVRATVPIELLNAESAAKPDPDNNGVLVLDGESAVRIEVPQGLARYTLECWVRGGEPKGRAAVATKTEGSGYGIFWADHGTTPTALVGTSAGYLRLPAREPWNWERWTHLAVVFDAGTARFFVNGRPVAEETTEAALADNRLPLYVGADPDRDGRPNSFFEGMVDEVRLSDIARYAAPFTPDTLFDRDKHTVVLLHFDQPLGGAFPDDSGTGRHGWAVGEPRIERAKR